MQILQVKDKKWYLNKRLIVSPTKNLKDVVFGEETLSYSIMRNFFVVAESYEQTHEYLMGCYVAFIRFSEDFRSKTRYVWVNSDAGTLVLNETFGKNRCYIGEIPKQYYRTIKEEINGLKGRSIVIEKDWYIRFRDSLVLSCHNTSEYKIG